MESSVGQTIERIKLQEQDIEMKLKEKRELNNAVLSTKRTIRDMLLHLEKLTKEHENLSLTNNNLMHQLAVEKIRHASLVNQVQHCCKELQERRVVSNAGVSTVWNKRTTLLETIQVIADKCDIWALLVKPACNDIALCAKVKPLRNNEQFVRDDRKLKNALERRTKAQAERNYLLSEPEVGEEFTRIRNALLYSLEIVDNIM